MAGSLMLALIGALFFLFLSLLQLLSSFSRPERKAVRRRLNALFAGDEAVEEYVDITKKEIQSGLPWLNRALADFAGAKRLGALLAQADVKLGTGSFLFLSFGLGTAGFVAAQALLGAAPLSLGCGLLMASLPLLHAKRRRAKRLLRFEEQLPEALDLVARALKAGQTFGSGMSMVVAEFDDPIRSEFALTMDETNFGLPVEEALENLAGRIASQDLRFFVISVNIQRQTGGNLSEIVESIALLIRDRFKFKGKVRTLSAEGRMSAITLLALPFVMTALINFLNPEFMSLLWTDPMGRTLAFSALVSMFFGAVVLRRMVNIQV